MQSVQEPQSSSRGAERLDLGFGDERAEDDPRAVAPRDQHRVLAVEADPGADGALAVDVVVLVDEHAVLAAEPAPERVQLLAQLGVGVEPRVARQPTLARLALGLRRVVAERGGDDRARVRQQRLRVTRDLGARHREPHVGEETALAGARGCAARCPRTARPAPRRRRRCRAPRRAAPAPLLSRETLCREVRNHLQT